jgi:uncharacterized cupin superfamily protein
MSRISKKKPSQEELDKMGVTGWGIWSCEPSTFDWHYDQTETCYVLQGEVTVKTADEEVDIESGDLVTFPQGLDCVWEVKAPIRKHYKFS